MNLYEIVGMIVVWYTIGFIAIIGIVWIPLMVLQYCINSDNADGIVVDPIYTKMVILPKDCLRLCSVMRYKDPRLIARIYGEIGIRTINWFERKYRTELFIL